MVIDIYFLENLSSLFAYKNFHHFFIGHFFARFCFKIMIQSSDSSEALFAASILEDNGHARNELWYVVIRCQVWFANFWLFRSSIFRRRKACFWQIFVIYSESCQRLIWSQPFSGMKYNCLYHIIITSICCCRCC